MATHEAMIHALALVLVAQQTQTMQMMGGFNANSKKPCGE